MFKEVEVFNSSQLSKFKNPKSLLYYPRERVLINQMETYLHKIEYLVKDKNEIDSLDKILEEIPIDVPFNTTIVIEPNRLPKEYFPYDATIYLDKQQGRLTFEDYNELKRKWEAKEFSSDIRRCANITDKKVLFEKVNITDNSCKIIPADSPEGVMVVYGDKNPPKRIHLTFWEGAYSEFL